MEYEVFEPNPDDEFYVELCRDAYARMFSEGREQYATEDAYLPVECFNVG